MAAFTRNKSKHRPQRARDAQRALTLWLPVDDLRRLRALRSATGVPAAIFVRRAISTLLSKVERDGVAAVLEVFGPSTPSVDPLT